MIAGSNKQRLEQEIASLTVLISAGREIFFKKTGFSLDSTDEYLNHWETLELFQKDPEFIQLDLNIQLFYIKLTSYFNVAAKEKVKGVKTARNAFGHDLTDLVFSKRVPYNFFLYKVSTNFKKIAYLFYVEDDKDPETSPKLIELNLNSDVNEFLNTWSKTS